MSVENSEELERRIIETFKKLLKDQHKRPVNLTEDNNPTSSLKHTKIFRIFGPTPSRLAFSDFIQISQLLNTSPVEILASVLSTPVPVVERGDSAKISDLTVNEFLQLLNNNDDDNSGGVLLSATDVIAKLGISNSTFHIHFKPYIPTYKIGNKHYYQMKDVYEFIKDNKTI